jgi:hypothetical protein
MRNEITLDALSNELQRNCGDVLAACRAVGVSLIFVNQWRKDDKKVDDVLTEAERVGTQGLVSAAIQRAVHGTEKGVYYKGVRVDTELQYSDSLLTTLLKAKVQEFAKDGEGSGVHVQVNVANLMPRANSYEQWLEMKSRTLDKPQDQLPAPDTDDTVPYDREQSLEALGRLMCEPGTIDAEFTEVRTPAFAGIEL